MGHFCFRRSCHRVTLTSNWTLPRSFPRVKADNKPPRAVNAVLTAEENNLLCLVEGDAPMGQIFRRHWLPACLIEEVPEGGGAPVRVSLLGEKLVAFRDSEGRVGLIGEFCPHRRASLFFGRNEECG